MAVGGGALCLYNFMGNCTYIMAKNCHVDGTHPDFEVDIKNINIPDSNLTAVRMVTIKVYGTTIDIVHLDFGRVRCQENSHYERCGSACPATCGDITAPSTCKASCLETCTCDDGFLLSGNKCIRKAQCGCKYNGRYVEVGAAFWGDNSCTERYTCSAEGKLTSEKASCPLGQQCRVVNGIIGCNPMDYATCMVSGDPHFLTFDGEHYNFQGTCTYELAGVSSSQKTLEHFSVILQNSGQDKRIGSVVNLIEVQVYGNTFNISKTQPGFVTVNGELSYLPIALNGTKLQLYTIGWFVVLETDFGLKVYYDWNSVAFVEVPSTYKGSMIGLCGNYNLNPKDDMQLKDGKEAATAEELGQSWKVASTPGCVDGCTGPCPGCTATQKDQYKCNTFCGLISDPAGPFRDCHSVKCEVKNGVRSCQPVGKGVCSIYGDPHYNTFDNSTYNFQGTCTYTVAETCNLNGKKLPAFSVAVENERWYGMTSDPQVSVAKLVAVDVYGSLFILRKNQMGMIMVNGILSYIPLNFNEGEVQVYQEGTYYVILTDFGLRVTYDMVYHVTVTVPGNYRGHTCGLCGNFNDNKADEFQLPDGKETKDVLSFGAAWKVAVSGVVCEDGCSGDNCPKCDSSKKEVFEKDCQVLTNPHGPFAVCHNVIDPASYYRDCVYDVCMAGGDRAVLCHSIGAYVLNCQVFGVQIQSWRTPDFCPLSCRANSHYEVCGQTCDSLCQGLSNTIACPDTCAEGCACNAGFNYNGTGCVSSDQCSCYFQGRTYKVNGRAMQESSFQKKNIALTVSGNTVAIKWGNSLQLSFNAVNDLTMSISADLAEKVCGACGSLRSVRTTAIPMAYGLGRATIVGKSGAMKGARYSCIVSSDTSRMPPADNGPHAPHTMPATPLLTLSPLQPSSHTTPGTATFQAAPKLSTVLPYTVTDRSLATETFGSLVMAYHFSFSTATEKAGSLVPLRWQASAAVYVHELLVDVIAARVLLSAAVSRGDGHRQLGNYLGAAQIRLALDLNALKGLERDGDLAAGRLKESTLTSWLASTTTVLSNLPLPCISTLTGSLKDTPFPGSTSFSNT
ncbi:hypothetical protein CRUP_002162 [Coryphaenoides rupestris]|nr:hypothetical protein CRUP_002162 [Coryphaenoides rupestris]